MNTKAFFFAILVLSSCGTERYLSNIGEKQIKTLEQVQTEKKFIPRRSQKKHVIIVNNQESFDRINTLITNAIKGGDKNIIIRIEPGVYYYNSFHIHRENEKNDASISIEGSKAALIAKGKLYQNGDECYNGFDPDATLVDLKSLGTYTCWDTLRFADGLIEVIDKQQKKCRLPSAQLYDLSEKNCKGVYIQITQWYESYRYKVDYIKDGWVYFTAGGLEKSVISENGYNVNDDFLYGGTYPRFMLCNAPTANQKVGVWENRVKTASGSFLECKASNFLNLSNTEFNSITIKGIHFIGKCNGMPLIKTINTGETTIRIEGCEFSSMFSGVIGAEKTKHLYFDNNKVRGTDRNGLYFSNGCEDIRITNCLFEEGGKSVAYSYFVYTVAKDFYIANNTFRNFSYSAIGAGVSRGVKGQVCSGIIENNEIYYTKDFFDQKENYTSMDAGAIQLRTQTDGIIVRYNYIHDYVGMKDNRGIFCDEGARNLKIYSNVILNTPNCYSIDSRRVNREAMDSLNNTGNVVMYNVVDGKIRFVGNVEANNGCMKEGNVLIVRDGDVPINHQYGQIEVSEDDITIDGISDQKTVQIFASKEEIEAMKHVPGFKKINKYLKKK